MKKTIGFSAACLFTLLSSLQTAAFAQDGAAKGLERLRAIYRELIEIDTTASRGDTAKAAQAAGARLKAAKFPSKDVHVFVQGPRKGDLVARLRGSGAKRPILLLAHIDVVEAKPEDWSTDPFKLVEKDGFLYARGSIDDKAMAAIFLDNLIRYKEEGFKPVRDIVIALTTDEETPHSGQNGVQWLLKNHPELLEAEFGLNEGGGGVSKNGKPLHNSIQTSEKLFSNFTLEVTNPGGHSSAPPKENAIYRLAAGLSRLAAFDFPLHLNDTTRAYFEKLSALEEGELAADMKSVSGPKPKKKSIARLSAVPRYNAQLRTTCVATLLNGGHADNALPQLAKANVNCRIMPDETPEDVLATLQRVVADDQIKVSLAYFGGKSPPSPVQGEVMSAVQQLTEAMWPGTPVLPSMSAGATDGRFLRNAGIPVYGTSGLFTDINDNRTHGKDERLAVKSLYEGQDYLYRLVKTLTEK